LLRHINDLGGRHVVIVHGPRRRMLLTDAGGLRQVFFAFTVDGPWCASQPLLLQAVLGLPPDHEASDYAASDDFLGMRGGHIWPGYGCSVAGVTHLLPNHLLDLDTGRDERFWPQEPLPARSYDEVRDELAATLRGLWLAAHQRSPLTLLLTAGHDSRLLLAAARPITSELRFVRILRRGGEADDVHLPSRLLAGLGLPHIVADGMRGPTNDFWSAYRATAPFPDRFHAANAEAISSAVRSRWGVTGHVSGVAKAHYRSRLGRLEPALTPARVSLKIGTGRHRYAVAAQREWLERVPVTSDVHPLDLLNWEQRVGNWASMWALQYDLVWKDVLMPFNCRTLLASLLGLPEDCRRPGNMELWEDLMARWWPELLRVPFGGNPPRPGLVQASIARSLALVRGGLNSSPGRMAN
ncbi:MAG: hypothetical protein M3332_17885, partial [Actinomycetota bacterium]|nr:hypothetical protein [Actinomycetota bacterium]